MRWLIALIVILALVGLLLWLFPHAIRGEQDRFQLLYGSLLMIPASLGALALRRQDLPRAARQALAWVIIIAVLVLGYSFRHDLAQNRLVAELMPSRARIASDGSISIRAGEDGHFHLDATVNGARVRFMVDTGASDIVLAPGDAERAGFDSSGLRFTRRYNTANGTVPGAPVVIGVFEVGPVKLNDVAASVNRAAMDQSLLGMSFLRRFRSFSISGDTLTLVP